MSAILITLISQALGLIVSGVTKGKYNLPDVAPALNALNDAIGHVAGETEQERTQRRADAEAVFAKHSQSFLSGTGPAVTP